MKLEEFVNQSIEEIVRGIGKSVDTVRKMGGVVTPSSLDGVTVDVTRQIEFDVAVTTFDAETGESGAGVFVGAFGLGGKLESESSSKSETRIKFTLPMKFPSDY